VFMGGATVAAGKRVLTEHGLVSFDSPTDVVEALDALAKQLPKPTSETRTTTPAAAHASLAMMPIHEMQQLLTDYDLPLAGVLAPTPDDVEKALGKLGSGPYAMKAIAPELVHKSDLNAVRVGLVNAEAVQAAWKDMETTIKKALPECTLGGMLLQNMAEGVECILGMKRDRTFGTVIVFGLGGIFVEVIKDSSMRIAPVSKDEALAQIQEIKGLPLLTGARGTKPVDLDALASAIASLSHLALDYPDIEEIDLNPVFASAKGVEVVDARFMVRGEKHEE